MSSGRVSVPDDALDRVACASLVDAMGRIHSHRAHILSLASPAPRRLFGPAVTIAFLPYRDDSAHTNAGFGALFHEAVGEAPAGKVLVMSSGGYPDASHGGGMKLSRLEHCGAAGVLTDGRLRDFEQLGGYSFATWCRGQCRGRDRRRVRDPGRLRVRRREWGSRDPRAESGTGDRGSSQGRGRGRAVARSDGRRVPRSGVNQSDTDGLASNSEPRGPFTRERR
jgi:regulator of ribonuclease E activity RraA/HMG-CHA aldolase family protein